MLFKLLPYFTQNGYPEVVNIIDQLPNHPRLKYSKRSITGIDKIILHHTASEAALKNQAAYHVNGRGWPRIGYSIVIVKDKIYQTNYLDTMSYHCAGQNEHGLGVCILADFTKRKPTETERRLLTAVILSLKHQFPHIKEVDPHKKYQPTSCPVIPIEGVREDVIRMEEEMSFQVDVKALSADAYKLAVRVKDLQGKIKHPTWGKEAARKLGLLKVVVEGQADVIATTILSLYNAANKQEFIGEESDKLAEIINEAKKVKLI